MTNFKPVPNPTQPKRKNVRKPVKQNAESMCSTQQMTTHKRKGKITKQTIKNLN